MDTNQGSQVYFREQALKQKLRHGLDTDQLKLVLQNGAKVLFQNRKWKSHAQWKIAYHTHQAGTTVGYIHQDSDQGNQEGGENHANNL